MTKPMTSADFEVGPLYAPHAKVYPQSVSGVFRSIK